MNMRSISIARSVAVIGATGALILGATYAAVIGTASLTGNTLTASAGLQVSLDNTTYGLQASGFDFGSLAPGGTASTHSAFWLKNTTGGDVDVTVKASSLTGFAHLDKAKVKVHFQKDGSTTEDVETLAALAAADQPLTDGPGGTGTKYEVWVTLDAGALTGGSVTNAGGFDLDFTGNTVTPAP